MISEEDSEATQGEGPQEDDMFISWDHNAGAGTGRRDLRDGGYIATSSQQILKDDDGELVETNRTKLEKRLKRYRNKHGYWPNVWFVDDHGGNTLIQDLGK